MTQRNAKRILLVNWKWNAVGSLLAAGLAACGGGGGDGGVSIPYFPVSAPAVAVDVYASGHRYPENSGTPVPCIWKNGVRTDLDGTDSIPSGGIAVSNGKVYTVGHSGDSGTHHACFWVDGQQYLLEPGNESSAQAIQVDGEVVRVLGWAKNGTTPVLRLWQGTVGASFTYTDYFELSMDTWPSDYAIVGTDVYVVGGVYAAGNWNAYYRKNNEDQQVCQGQWIKASRLYVDGSDVYVTGYTDDVFPTPFYWKNGLRVDLPGTAQVGPIRVSNGNVYALGVMNTVEHGGVGIVWKNGTAYALPSNGVSATAMAVIGDDVYAAGNHAGAHDTACYWQNGTTVDLDGSMVHAIAVVPR